MLLIKPGNLGPCELPSPAPPSWERDRPSENNLLLPT